MDQIKTITLALPFRLGEVNCYLVRRDAGFVLIDTGPSNRRSELEQALASAGCTPSDGNLSLIVLTHGDFDHTGNAAYLRQEFGAKIAMHGDDAGMAERGDMFWSRSSRNALLHLLAPILFRFPKSNRFRPDVSLEDGDSLVQYGLDARVLSIPGYSRGSIGILMASSDLFCGDLLENPGEPTANSIMDDPAACMASIKRLEGLGIRTVYPGHGASFPMSSFLAAHHQKGS
jgi:hydroxyacylglutathione hydrolase